MQAGGERQPSRSLLRGTRRWGCREGNRHGAQQKHADRQKGGWDAGERIANTQRAFREGQKSHTHWLRDLLEPHKGCEEGG